jgi:hypothetical protein
MPRLVGHTRYVRLARTLVLSGLLLLALAVISAACDATNSMPITSWLRPLSPMQQSLAAGPAAPAVMKASAGSQSLCHPAACCRCIDHSRTTPDGTEADRKVAASAAE